MFLASFVLVLVVNSTKDTEKLATASGTPTQEVARALQAWREGKNKNCFPGSGAEASLKTLKKELKECKQACKSTSGCNCITWDHHKPNDGYCHLRKNCDFSQCKHEGERWVSYIAPDKPDGMSDQSLGFNPSQNSANSPITNSTSHCHSWYNSNGPAFHTSNQRAAEVWKNRFVKATKGHNSDATDGTGWAIGFKHGCTRVNAAGGKGSWIDHMRICGCYEIWCPTMDSILQHPDD